MTSYLDDLYEERDAMEAERARLAAEYRALDDACDETHFPEMSRLDCEIDRLVAAIHQLNLEIDDAEEGAQLRHVRLDRAYANWATA